MRIVRGLKPAPTSWVSSSHGSAESTRIRACASASRIASALMWKAQGALDAPAAMAAVFVAEVPRLPCGGCAPPCESWAAGGAARGFLLGVAFGGPSTESIVSSSQRSTNSTLASIPNRPSSNPCERPLRPASSVDSKAEPRVAPTPLSRPSRGGGEGERARERPRVALEGPRPRAAASALRGTEALRRLAAERTPADWATSEAAAGMTNSSYDDAAASGWYSSYGAGGSSICAATSSRAPRTDCVTDDASESRSKAGAGGALGLNAAGERPACRLAAPPVLVPSGFRDVGG